MVFPLTLLGSLQLRGQNRSARRYLAPSRYFQEVRWRGAARIEISENGCSKKRGAFFFLPLEKLPELSAPSSLHQWSQRVTLSRFRSFKDPRSTPWFATVIVSHTSTNPHMLLCPFLLLISPRPAARSLGSGDRSYFIMSTSVRERKVPFENTG